MSFSLFVIIFYFPYRLRIVLFRVYSGQFQRRIRNYRPVFLIRILLYYLNQAAGSYCLMLLCQQYHQYYRKNAELFHKNSFAAQPLKINHEPSQTYTNKTISPSIKGLMLGGDWHLFYLVRNCLRRAIRLFALTPAGLLSPNTL